MACGSANNCLSARQGRDPHRCGGKSWTGCTDSFTGTFLGSPLVSAPLRRGGHLSSGPRLVSLHSAQRRPTGGWSNNCASSNPSSDDCGSLGRAAPVRAVAWGGLHNSCPWRRGASLHSPGLSLVLGAVSPQLRSQEKGPAPRGISSWACGCHDHEHPSCPDTCPSSLSKPPHPLTCTAQLPTDVGDGSSMEEILAGPRPASPRLSPRVLGLCTQWPRCGLAVSSAATRGGGKLGIAASN